MDYIRKGCSKYLLMAHIILVCKYRKQLLEILGKLIKEDIEDISKRHNIEIITMETDKDHIHILVKYNPKQSVLEIVRLFKQITTYNIWRNENNIKYLQKHFWKEKTFWSDGYFVSSIGNVSKETIEKYIIGQG